MRIFLVSLLSACALAGCAALGGKALATCDGRHRRPANPYGSVLAPPAPISVGVPGPLSAAETFASCQP